ncbi:type VII secretion target [Mycobacterium hubeiense]|uniref:type VII secretion target n=1 Tax=Mycobacterium hubeiense TaxID=1867256 RepID=UPI000C7F414D|nr:type VII secretion target [Mycobacterium sp. QGD 101]
MTTPSGELRTDPNHLRELSAIQSDAAAQIAKAAPLTDNVAAAVQRSHGVACMTAALAAEKVAAARKEACIAMESVSTAYAVSLNTAASQYIRTDSDSGDKIDGEMRPGG